MSDFIGFLALIVIFYFIYKIFYGETTSMRVISVSRSRTVRMKCTNRDCDEDVDIEMTIQPYGHDFYPENLKVVGEHVCKAKVGYSEDLGYGKDY
jgi:hypothetical protein